MTNKHFLLCAILIFSFSCGDSSKFKAPKDGNPNNQETPPPTSEGGGTGTEEAADENKQRDGEPLSDTSNPSSPTGSNDQPNDEPANGPTFRSADPCEGDGTDPSCQYPEDKQETQEDLEETSISSDDLPPGI